MTTKQKRQFFKDRYALMVAPLLLLLLLGVSLGSANHYSELLAWVSGSMLAGLTVNRLVR
ncbi:hypothetical protein B7G68_21210 [Caulobacter segnis]|uniref:ABA-induced protein n=3 Tax=Caulobacter segnis TaxID=88688 RepID=D5VPZ1_CAUST|nr:hypothetical protein [Caulobacter segnis]ADG12564.1 ABA-induced protein [Caulobacter segnis ATCC 21756]AVQ04140.1 hypothetical protein B7G68_21210 [Caulobacter segnis]